MEKFFSIGEAAEMVGMTAETLRHYDRIGLIRPHKTDEWTKYRYYTEREIVLLETVRALRCMELPLNEIRQLLQCDDVAKIAAFLQNAEAHADEKIAQLREAKERIGRAKRFYEGKAAEQPKRGGIYACRYPARVILLSHTLRTPTVENLHDYHRHFKRRSGRRGAENLPLRTRRAYTRRRATRPACSPYANALPRRTACAPCPRENTCARSARRTISPPPSVR